MRQFLCAVLLTVLAAAPIAAQFTNDGTTTANNVPPNSFIFPLFRSGLTGIGFGTLPDFQTSFGQTTFPFVNRAGFLVRGLPLGHIDGAGSVFGQLDNGSTWSGLGSGNPGGVVVPYGLSMTRASIQAGSNPPVIDASGNSFSVNNKRPVMTFTANGRVGINNINPACEIGGRPVFLDVSGWINSTNGLLVGSDRRFKKDIKPIEGAMDKIRRLQGTTYNMRTDEFPERAFGEGRQYGFIAQDLERVIPELTGVNSDGFYAVNYIALIPVLTEAIKEQDKTIAEQAEVNAAQATTITELRTEIAELRSAFNDFKAGQAANGVEGYRLEQNAPNPFSQNTVIGYAVPAGTTGARINVYDLAGRLVKSFNIADQSGQITINAGDMSNGLYIYDLQVNGRQILERKMTVVKD